jgi:integrase
MTVVTTMTRHTPHVAIVAFLAGAGARAGELCSATIGDIDRSPERPIWRVNVGLLLHPWVP